VGVDPCEPRGLGGVRGTPQEQAQQGSGEGISHPDSSGRWMTSQSPRNPASGGFLGGHALLPRYSMIESVRMSASVSRWVSPSSALAAVGSPK
jgi:hypothetical protein